MLRDCIYREEEDSRLPQSHTTMDIIHVYKCCFWDKYDQMGPSLGSSKLILEWVKSYHTFKLGYMAHSS